MEKPVWKLRMRGLEFARVLANGSRIKGRGPIAEVVVQSIVLDNDHVDAVHTAVQLLLDQGT